MCICIISACGLRPEDLGITSQVPGGLYGRTNDTLNGACVAISGTLANVTAVAACANALLASATSVAKTDGALSSLVSGLSRLEGCFGCGWMAQAYDHTLGPLLYGSLTSSLSSLGQVPAHAHAHVDQP